MAVVALVLLVASLVPEAEYPWPERIGIGFPFTLAGGFGVAAGSRLGPASLAERDRAARIASVVGFWIGSMLYAALLVVRVAS